MLAGGTGAHTDLSAVGVASEVRGTALATTLSTLMHTLPHPLQRASLALILSSLASCATSVELNELVLLHRAGAEKAAVERLRDDDVKEELRGDRDGLLWRLEAGKILQDAGRIEESERQFQAADVRMREFDAEPVIRIGGEIGGLLTNPGARAYRGKDTRDHNGGKRFRRNGP